MSLHRIALIASQKDRGAEAPLPSLSRNVKDTGQLQAHALAASLPGHLPDDRDFRLRCDSIFGELEKRYSFFQFLTVDTHQGGATVVREVEPFGSTFLVCDKDTKSFVAVRLNFLEVYLHCFAWLPDRHGPNLSRDFGRII